MERERAGVTALIGDTPMVRLHRYGDGAGARIHAKLEGYNPGSSVKDRIALSMIEAAEADGSLGPNATIIEPTSGNTGIGLAMVGRSKGYRVILTMPESMSVERRKLLRSLGAELVLTEGRDGMVGAISEAEQLVEDIDGAFMPGQFDNPANPEVHYRTTGPEIWAALDGRVDVFVAGVGTGGTITGVARYLKEQNPQIWIVAVEPAESAVLSGAPRGPHMIQGIGAGFVPEILEMGLVNEVMKITSLEAIGVARVLSQTEGLLAGISSGAAAAAARQIAERPEFQDKNVVAVFPDTSERYASTLLFYED